MVFSGILFIFYFLPIFLLVYQIARQKQKNWIILIASILFYSWGAPKFVFVILASTILDFFIVRKIWESEGVKKKLFLSASLAMNLGLLAYFKYANFFIDNVNAFLSNFGGQDIIWTKIALPIGISFYTFQTLTYAVDVYRGQHAPLKKVNDYLLYIMSFPQMIAGPIVRYNTIATQITNREDTYNNKLIGFYRFSIGLAKKILIANVMGAQADLIMNGDIAGIGSNMAWLATIAYTLQIYFDFAGYSDMAIGLGRMMGFTFPENFNSPYISKSITEFWRRWHITLGGFMRDYLYIPLGGSRVTPSRVFFNLWFIFLVSGLWHGASWNFVLWGAFHGFFLILDRAFLLKVMEKAGKIPSIILTFFIVMVGWVIFRLEDFEKMKIFLAEMFSGHASLSLPKTTPEFYPILIIAIIFSFIGLSKVGKKLEDFFFFRKEYSPSQNILLSVFSVVLVAICAGAITTTGFNPFIYFRF
ncbi:MAG: MBOAT family protein [Bacteroidales bacterium]